MTTPVRQVNLLSRGSWKPQVKTKLTDLDIVNIHEGFSRGVGGGNLGGVIASAQIVDTPADIFLSILLRLIPV